MYNDAAMGTGVTVLVRPTGFQTIFADSFSLWFGFAQAEWTKVTARVRPASRSLAAPTIADRGVAIRKFKEAKLQ